MAGTTAHVAGQEHPCPLAQLTEHGKWRLQRGPAALRRAVDQVVRNHIMLWCGHVRTVRMRVKAAVLRMISLLGQTVGRREEQGFVQEQGAVQAASVCRTAAWAQQPASALRWSALV